MCQLGDAADVKEESVKLTGRKSRRDQAKGIIAIIHKLLGISSKCGQYLGSFHDAA